jgi:hypothetical protein
MNMIIYQSAKTNNVFNLYTMNSIHNSYLYINIFILLFRN